MADSHDFYILKGEQVCARVVIGTEDVVACMRMFREPTLTLSAVTDMCKVSKKAHIQMQNVSRVDRDNSSNSTEKALHYKEKYTNIFVKADT